MPVLGTKTLVVKRHPNVATPNSTNFDVLQKSTTVWTEDYIILLLTCVTADLCVLTAETLSTTTDWKRQELAASRT